MTATAARRAQLTALVVDVFAEFDQTYGCRRIAVALNRRGVAVSVGTVAAIMRDQGLQAVQPRAYKVTTVPGEGAAGEQPADLVARAFTPDAEQIPPGSVLVGDITYLHTGEGWLYLATVIDLTTRMVVGWQLGDRLTTPLVTDALAMACEHGRVRPGAIFHSDRGCQYTSRVFRRFCAARGIRVSVGRTGTCYDNAVAESFFATLKNEMYHRYRFPTRKEARSAVVKFIEVFYNRKRHHSTIQYLTPSEAWERYNRTAAVAA